MMVSTDDIIRILFEKYNVSEYERKRSEIPIAIMKDPKKIKPIESWYQTLELNILLNHFS